MPGNSHTDESSRADVVGSIALMLNVAAVISAALWVATAGGAQHGVPVVVIGIVAVACLTASIACFAAGDRDG